MVVHQPRVPVVLHRPLSTPSNPTGGLQTRCHGKGAQHHLCDPAQPCEAHVAPASTGVAAPHLSGLFSLVRLSLCHLCYHHTSPQDPKPWLHMDRWHFGDSRRGGGFFQGVSEPQVTVLESRELLAAPGAVKVFGLCGVGWGFGSKAHQAS